MTAEPASPTRPDPNQLLRQLGEGSCVLVSTHLVEDVAATCRSVTVMTGGRRAWQGSPEELARVAAGGAPGDTPLERGYTSVLRGAGDPT